MHREYRPADMHDLRVHAPSATKPSIITITTITRTTITTITTTVAFTS